MLGKDKFLEKTRYLVFFSILFFLKNLFATDIDSKILEYNNSLKNTSALFIQNDGESVDEGVIYFGNDRIKIEYTNQKNLTLILSNKKGVYINHDLKETQYFKTNKSYIVVFFKLINGNSFANKTDVSEKFIEFVDNFILENESYKIKLIYEIEPIKLRKVVVLEGDNRLEISFFNHNNLQVYKKNFFSMIDPYLN